MKALIAPDLSVTITEEESLHAFELYHHFDWDTIEAGLPEGAKDTSGVPINRHNRNLQIYIMGSLAVCKRVGVDQSVPESERLLNNPHFRVMVGAMIDAFEKTMRPTK